METIHHIYVDYENVQNIRLPLIAGKPVTVTLVLGCQQNTLPVELTSRLLEHAPQVRLVKTKAAGKNALDFVLACELGGHCGWDRNAAYHIISKDKGFDAVVEHLQSHGIRVARHEAFSAVPVLGAAPAVKVSARAVPAAVDERVALIVSMLLRNAANRPAKRKTLVSSIGAYFGRQLPEPEIEEVVDRLAAEKRLSISAAGGVTYRI